MIKKKALISFIILEMKARKKVHHIKANRIYCQMKMHIAKNIEDGFTQVPNRKISHVINNQEFGS